jgi:hypothetical protein
MPPKYGSFGVVFLVVAQNDNFLATLNSAVVLVGRAIAIKEAERGGSMGAATPEQPYPPAYRVVMLFRALLLSLTGLYTSTFGPSAQSS